MQWNSGVIMVLLRHKCRAVKVCREGLNVLLFPFNKLVLQLSTNVKQIPDRLSIQSAMVNQYIRLNGSEIEQFLSGLPYQVPRS